MSKINYVLIGKRIRETRIQLKLSQAALAEMSGLSTRYISHIETARKKASLSSLVNIANAVGISVDEILYGNQTAYKSDYQLDIVLLIEDCTPSEKRYLEFAERGLIIENPAWLLSFRIIHAIIDAGISFIGLQKSCI